jgi:hypothetical protein
MNTQNHESIKLIPFNLKKLNESCGDRFHREINILECAFDAASSLLTVFDQSEDYGTSEAKNFYIKALLVFSTAGLDSMIKHLIRNVLHDLVDTTDDTKKEMLDFVHQKLLNEKKIISETLINKSQRTFLAEQFIAHLTDGSLLSKNELLKVLKVLGIKTEKPDQIGILKKETGSNKCTIDRIFEVRNQIVHDLDIDFSVPGQRLRIRNRNEIINWTNFIFEKSELILYTVALSIRQSPAVKEYL